MQQAIVKFFRILSNIVIPFRNNVLPLQLQFIRTTEKFDVVERSFSNRIIKPF